MKRYDIKIPNKCTCKIGEGGSACNCFVIRMGESPEGEWVKYDDVVDLLVKDLMLECDYEKESIKKQMAGIDI